MELLDLRSDTVTRPSAGMRQAMAAAEVGDDVYGEDPTVRALEERVADLLRKDAALFVPSGTMGNQIALFVQTRRGDEVVIGEGAHCSFYEAGAGAAWSGVQFRVAGTGGLFTADELSDVINPPHYYLPRTSLVAVENTHNRAGGRVFPQREVLRVAECARAHRLAMHLDGARLWNAAIACGLSPAELAAPFDTVSVCFSKGLGAPVGSALAASSDLIQDARRTRRMLGGGMRQAGILAAAALWALEHNRSRLADDHGAARQVAEIVAASQYARVDLAQVETNIVNVMLTVDRAEAVARAAAPRGVLLNATARNTLRLVTHLDISAERARRAAELLAAVIDEICGAAASD